jgi:hypothetical protein
MRGTCSGVRRHLGPDADSLPCAEAATHRLASVSWLAGQAGACVPSALCGSLSPTWARCSSPRRSRTPACRPIPRSTLPLNAIRKLPRYSLKESRRRGWCFQRASRVATDLQLVPVWDDAAWLPGAIAECCFHRWVFALRPASQGAWVPRFVSRLARRPGAVVTPTVFLAMRAHCNEEAASLAIVEIAT